MTHRINKRTQQTETVYPNRTPTRSEVFAHAPILDYELMEVQPKLIATLGNIGLQRLLGKEYTVTKNHGQLYTGPVLQLTKQKDAYEWSEKNYRILPLFHPAAIFLQSFPCTCYPSRLASTSFTFTARLKRTDKTIKSVSLQSCLFFFIVLMANCSIFRMQCCQRMSNCLMLMCGCIFP